jgi:hypothetical protein
MGRTLRLYYEVTFIRQATGSLMTIFADEQYPEAPGPGWILLVSTVGISFE